MLRDSLTQAMKDAMKSGDKARLSTVRMVLAAIKDKDIEQRGIGKDPLNADEILATLQKMVKQRQDSAKMYIDGGRQELADIENAEIAIIQSFMPAQMSDEEAQAAVKAVVVELGATSMKDMGGVMASLRAKYAGRMDFGKASGWIKAALS